MPSALVAIGASIVGALVTSATAAAGVAISAALGAVVAMGTMFVANSILGLDSTPDLPDFPSFNQESRGILANKTGNSEQLNVPYGSRRIGGVRTFIGVTGPGNEYLHLVISLGEGPISAINTVYLDDIPETDERFSGLLRIKRHLGAYDQAADTDLVSEIEEWTANHRGLGVAYVYLRIKYDREVFSRIPVITADVDGRVIYDPRDATEKFSNNALPCNRDYLTHLIYGRGVDTSTVDDVWHQAEANYCDEQIDIAGETKARYTCDGVVDTGRQLKPNMDRLLTACRGMLVYSGGKWRIAIDRPRVPTSFEFNENNVVGKWTIDLGNQRNTFNRVSANFFNPEKNWEADIAPVDAPDLRLLDGGRLLETQIDLLYTADHGRASMIGTINLNQSRQQIACKFRCTVAGTRAEVGNVVPITHQTPGWESKLFLILGMDLHGNDEITVLAREYEATVYNYGTINPPASPDTLLPDLLDPPPLPETKVFPVSGLEVVGQGNNTVWSGRDLRLRWNRQTIRWPLNADAEPSGAGTYPEITDQAYYRIQVCNLDGAIRRERNNLTEPQYVYSYEKNTEDGTPEPDLLIKVWARNWRGFESSPAIITVANPPPVAVTGLTAAPFMAGVSFSWSHNSETDFWYYKYRTRVGDDPWSKWDVTPTNGLQRPLTQTEKENHGGDANIYLEVIAQDTFGSESAVQSINSQATNYTVGPYDIEKFAINASMLFAKIPILDGETLSSNSPQAGSVSWTAHNLYFNGVEYPIAAGATDQRYIWWDNGSNAYSVDSEHPADSGALDEGDFIIFTNDGGKARSAWNALVNLVVGSAYIANLAVKDAHVESIHGNKIIAQSILLSGLAGEVTDRVFTSAVRDFADLGGVTKPEDYATQNRIYRQVAEPAGSNGDLWYDTDNSLFYRHNGTFWELVGNAYDDTNQLNDGANLGQTAVWDSIADIPYNLFQIFFQAAAPTAGMETGDYWIASGNNKTYRYNGSSWVEIQDEDIAQALTDAATAQSTAEGKIVTFVQSTPPTAEATGDLWLDSDDDFKMYRWNGSAWVDVSDVRIVQAISDAAGAQATADGKVTTFYQTGQPIAEGTGDLWVDTDDGNKLYRWSGSAWIDVRDSGIGTAITNAATAQSTADDAQSSANTAQATADGKVTTFYQAGQPTAEGSGDLWVDTDDGNKLYRWSGSAWMSVRDTDIVQALSDAATAQSTADGKIVTFYQTGQPTAVGTGDIWFDTDDGHKQYRWSGSAWIDVRDSGIGTAITNAATAQSTADGAQSSANSAQATADGKVTTFYQTGQPTAEGTGDLWVDTDDGNKLYRWSGSAWVLVRDTDIAQALSDAATAQSTADGKIVTFYQTGQPVAEGTGDIWFDTDDGHKQYRWSGSAWVAVQDSGISQAISDAATAQSTADGKITTFYQTSAPTAEGTGDLWVDTDDNNKPYRWNGSAWEAIEYEVATWSKIGGAGKPDDNATQNSIYRQSAQPTGSAGDIWFDTDDNKLYRHSGSSWELVGNAYDNTNQLADGANLGQTAVWTSITSRPTELTDGRVGTGLNSSGEVKQMIKGGNLPATTPSASGLHMNATFLGYYDSGAGTWPVYIKNDGTFLFKVSDDHYFENDGSQFTFKGRVVIKPHIIQGNFLSRYYNSKMGDRDAYYLGNAGDGSATWVDPTSGTGESYAYIRSGSNPAAGSSAILQLNKRAPMEFCGFAVTVGIDDDGTGTGIVGEIMYGSPTSDRFGFRFYQDGSMKAVSYDGMLETTVTVTKPTSWFLSAHFDSDKNEIKYYVDGDLAATITTNLPNQLVYTLCHAKVSNAAAVSESPAASIDIKLWELSIWSEYPGASFAGFWPNG